MANKFRKEEEVYLKGIIRWCKHLRPDFTFDPVGKWSVTMYIEGLELEKARDWQSQGIRNRIKKDDDGWCITLSRKCSLITKGRTVGLEPPRVIDMAGVPIEKMVGNGSTGIAKCVLWSFNPTPTVSGKALRWEELRVDNLVEFTPASDYPDGGESLKGILSQEALF